MLLRAPLEHLQHSTCHEEAAKDVDRRDTDRDSSQHSYDHVARCQAACNLQQRADSFHLVYKTYTRQMAKNLEGQVLGEFLKGLYPKTYLRKYPDGRVVTIDADTNKEMKNEE